MYSLKGVSRYWPLSLIILSSQQINYWLTGSSILQCINRSHKKDKNFKKESFSDRIIQSFRKKEKKLEKKYIFLIIISKIFGTGKTFNIDEKKYFFFFFSEWLNVSVGKRFLFEIFIFFMRMINTL